MQAKTIEKKPQPSQTAIGERQRQRVSVNAFHRQEPLAEMSSALLPFISRAEARFDELVAAARLHKDKAGPISTVLAQPISAAVLALYDCYAESQDTAMITRLFVTLRKRAVTAYIERGTNDFESRLESFKPTVAKYAASESLSKDYYPGLKDTAKTVIAMVAEQEADQLVHVVLFSLGSRVAVAQATTFVNTIQSSLSAPVATEGATAPIHIDDVSSLIVFPLLEQHVA